jgi:hypothetical protein
MPYDILKLGIILIAFNPRWGSLDEPEALGKGNTEAVIYRSNWRLVHAPILQTLIYGPGRHEIHLDLALDLGDHMRETVDGVDGYSVAYSLNGRATRRFVADLKCRERIKVYRNPPIIGWESVSLLPVWSYRFLISTIIYIDNAI